MSEETRLDDTRPVSGPQPNESPKERVDRELRELLEETRVILPGVEILFGFLIILPFQFSEEIPGFERLLYLGAFLSVSAGLALLVAPTLYHRINFRATNKERLLFLANRLFIAAAIFLASGIALTVYLVVETLVGGAIAGVLAALNAGWLAWFWFGLPMLSRLGGDASDD